MKPGSLEYDARVRMLLEAREIARQKHAEDKMHKTIVLTESECAQEIKGIQDGAVSGFEGEIVKIDLGNGSSIEYTGSDSEKFKTIATEVIQPKPYTGKKRGRKKGSKNKPKA